MDDDVRRVDALARPHGALDVVVYGARGIKSSSSLRILKLLCVVECAGARFKTRSKRTRGSPEWHASGRLTFRAPVRVDDEVVRVSVWDKRMGGHKCMGSATASLRDVVAGTYANGKKGPTPWNLALEGCKYPGASVQVNLRMVGGDATPRGDEPGDAAAATTDGEEDVSFDAEERASGGGEGEMIVRTVMTPLKETREDVEDTSEENAEGSEENAEQEDEEDEEDEESDEWAAALRPSSPVPSTSDAVEPEMEMNKKKKVPEPRELASKFADIWAEDSMDDVVVVSPPPPPPRPPRIVDANSSVTEKNESRARSEVEFHTVRHVKSPTKPKEPIEEPTEEVVVANASNHAQSSPERPIKSAMKASPMLSPIQPRHIESEDELVAAMLSPGRLHAPRVTFDERLVRTLPPKKQEPATPPKQAPKTIASSKENAPPAQNPSPSATKDGFTKRLFVERSKSPVKPFAMPTKAELDEARRLQVMYDRAESVFASWSW